MIFDYTDPIGAIQTIFSIIILVEIIQFMDKDDWSAHIQERVAFYNGIFGKVWGFLEAAGSGLKRVFSVIFPRKEKDPQPEKKKPAEVYQREEEDPFEGNGGIEG